MGFNRLCLLTAPSLDSLRRQGKTPKNLVVKNGRNLGKGSSKRDPFPDNQDLKPVNGQGQCERRVEVLRNGQWGTMCDYSSNWDMKDAAVVCRQLGCGEALSGPRYAHFGGGTGPVLVRNVNCKGQESALKDCQSETYSLCHHYYDVSAVCSEFKMLRLTDGCSGQLQVFYNNSWGSVCANNMDKATADKICKELGCGSLKSDVKEELSKLDPDPKWLDNVRCRGHEASVWQCPSSPWGKNTCTRTEVAEFSCSETLDLRLVGGTNNCSGRVEIKYGDTWGTVCDDDWDMKDVKVVCRQLRCGEPVSAELEFGGGRGVSG
ncbi:WC11 protein, partial [Polypterus senegalus]